MASSGLNILFTKYDKFDGTNADLQSWLRKFERCCTIAGKSAEANSRVQPATIFIYRSFSCFREFSCEKPRHDKDRNSCIILWVYTLNSLRILSKLNNVDNTLKRSWPWFEVLTFSIIKDFDKVKVVRHFRRTDKFLDHSSLILRNGTEYLSFFSCRQPTYIYVSFHCRSRNQTD